MFESFLVKYKKLCKIKKLTISDYLYISIFIICIVVGLLFEMYEKYLYELIALLVMLLDILFILKRFKVELKDNSSFEIRIKRIENELKNMNIYNIDGIECLMETGERELKKEKPINIVSKFFDIMFLSIIASILKEVIWGQTENNISIYLLLIFIMCFMIYCAGIMFDVYLPEILSSKSHMIYKILEDLSYIKRELLKKENNKSI